MGLDELLKASMIDQKSYNLVMTSRKDNELHPVQILANFRLANPNTHQILSIDALNIWLSAMAGMPLVRIDPLKVDVPAVTKIMSYEYAKNNHILPIEVESDKVFYWAYRRSG